MSEVVFTETVGDKTYQIVKDPQRWPFCFIPVVKTESTEERGKGFRTQDEAFDAIASEM